jgi:hypothetical protein
MPSTYLGTDQNIVWLNPNRINLLVKEINNKINPEAYTSLIPLRNHFTTSLNLTIPANNFTNLLVNGCQWPSLQQ